MEYEGIIRIRLDFEAQVRVNYRQQLEVALDCFVCRRRQRTVTLTGIGLPGNCNPTLHKFPGYLTDVSVREPEASFTFRYDYDPFTDLKYPDERRYAPWEKGAPSFARVRFDVTCPACGLVTQRGTQTNLVRPWTCVCSCGRRLYADRQAPELSWRQLPPQNVDPPRKS